LPDATGNDHAGAARFPPTRASGVEQMSPDSMNAQIQAYGFVGHTVVPRGDFIEAVLDVPGIRFAGRTVGSCVAVVAAECASLELLQDEILPEVAAAGATHVSWTTTTSAAKTKVPRWGRPPKAARTVCGSLIRVRTTQSDETLAGLQEIFDHLNSPDRESEGYSAGAMRVFGAGADVLLDLGAPDELSLIEQLLALGGLPSVTGYDVIVARWAENARWGDD